MTYMGLGVVYNNFLFSVIKIFRIYSIIHHFRVFAISFLNPPFAMDPTIKHPNIRNMADINISIVISDNALRNLSFISIYQIIYYFFCSFGDLRYLLYIYTI